MLGAITGDIIGSVYGFTHVKPDMDYTFFVKDSEFTECQLNLSSFFQMRLHKIEFTKCEIVEVDFGRSDLTGSFNDCDLHNEVFDNSNLSKCDFRKTNNLIIDPKNNKISKPNFLL